MKRALLLLALALAPACVSAKMFRTGSGATYPPTKPDAVLVYFNAEDVPHAYDVVAEILLEGSSGWGKNDADLVTKAQQKAGAVGAQGIIVTKQKGAGTGAAQFLGAADKVQRVQAIRFKE